MKHKGNLSNFRSGFRTGFNGVRRDKFSGIGLEVVEAYVKYVGPITDLEARIRHLLIGDSGIDSEVERRLTSLGFSCSVPVKCARVCSRCHEKCMP